MQEQPIYQNETHAEIIRQAIAAVEAHTGLVRWKDETLLSGDIWHRRVRGTAPKNVPDALVAAATLRGSIPLSNWHPGSLQYYSRRDKLLDELAVLLRVATGQDNRSNREYAESLGWRTCFLSPEQQAQLGLNRYEAS